MPTIGRNEKCPCGSNRKYKHCHGDPSGSLDSHTTKPVDCICDSGLRAEECCGAFLASPRRIRPSAKLSQFAINGWYRYDFTGKVYFSTLSPERGKWNNFRNFYLYGIEINGRFFRPKTLDVVLEIRAEDFTQWTVKCNLDFETAASITFRSSHGETNGGVQAKDCKMSLTNKLELIAVPNIKIVDHKFIRVFHHTSEEGFGGITSSRTIRVSPYDLQGSTRILQTTHFAYFTDLPQLQYESDLAAVAMKERGQAVFRTDDLTRSAFVDLYENPASKRVKRLTFYIDINLLAPVPAIYHRQDAGSQYVEFFHPHIFRVGSSPGHAFQIEEFMDGWKICEPHFQSKATEIYPIADGNNLDDLFKIYQDRYIEP